MAHGSVGQLIKLPCAGERVTRDSFYGCLMNVTLAFCRDQFVCAHEREISL